MAESAEHQTCWHTATPQGAWGRQIISQSLADITGKIHQQAGENSQESPVIVQGFQLLDKAQRPQAHMPQRSHLAIHAPRLRRHYSSYTHAHSLKLAIHTTKLHGTTSYMVMVMLMTRP